MSEISAAGFSTSRPFSVGRVERRMAEFAKTEGVTLAGGELYFSSRQIAHAMRPSKLAKVLAVLETDLATFPARRASMGLYFDTRNRTFVYSDGECKYIVHPNYEMRVLGKRRAVNFITAQKIGENDYFNGKSYKEVR